MNVNYRIFERNYIQSIPITILKTIYKNSLNCIYESVLQPDRCLHTTQYPRYNLENFALFGSWFLILETGLRRLIEKSFKIVVMREKLFEKSHEVLENEVNTKTTSNFSTEFIYKNSFRRTQYLFKKENNWIEWTRNDTRYKKEIQDSVQDEK